MAGVKKGRWLNRGLVLGPQLMLCIREAQFMGAVKDDGLAAPEGGWVIEGCDATTHSWQGIAGDNPIAIVCVCPRKKLTLSAMMGLLAHESRHVQEVMIRHKPDLPWRDEEFAAESLQSIMFELTQEWLRQTGRGDRLPGVRKARGRREEGVSQQ